MLSVFTKRYAPSTRRAVGYFAGAAAICSRIRLQVRILTVAGTTAMVAACGEGSLRGHSITAPDVPRLSASTKQDTVLKTKNRVRTTPRTRESLIISEDAIGIRGISRSLPMTATLKAMIDTATEVESSVDKIVARFESRGLFAKYRQQGRLANMEAQRAHAKRLTAKETSPMMSSVAYTCDDIAIAIYEQTLLYRAAERDFWKELATVTMDALIDQNLPGRSDFTHLATAAHDVWLWATSLNILATIYSANGCWN